MAESNPYSPPTEIDATSVPGATPSTVEGPPVRLLVTWPAVLAINLPVPILFASELLGPRGWAGVILAISCFLIGGWWFCFRFPGVLNRLIAGSLVVAASQFIPIAHLIAGLIGIEIAMTLGGTGDVIDGGVGPEINTVVGGWLVTTLTGAILAIVALVVGTLILLVISVGKREEPPTPA